MIKCTSIISCLMVSLTPLFGGVIEQTYTFNTFRIESVKDGYSRILLNDAVADGPTGDPSIPYHSIRLLLPPDEEISAWEITGSDTLVLPGTITLYPCQPQVPLSTKKIQGTLHLNKSVYSSPVVYPSSFTDDISTHYFNGYPVALGTFTPVRYNPVTGTLYLIQNVKVTLHTIRRKQLHKMSFCASIQSSSIKMLTSTVQNPDAVSQYRAPCSEGASAKMLIITKKEYQDGFKPLAEFHNNNGIQCSFAFVEDIRNEEHGVDEQEKIRNRIVKESQNTGIGYVLLGGDTSIVKARIMSTKSDSIIHADIYYASLDGNWNADKDNIWGEPADSCDLLPDIAVGRLPFGKTMVNMEEMEAPVHDVQTQLKNMVAKIVKYQKQPIQGELNKPYIITEFLDFQTPSTAIMDLLIGEKTANGLTTKGIPENDNIRKWNLGNDEIRDWYNVDSVLNGGPSAIYHCGHGQPEEFMGMFFKNDHEKRLKVLDGVTKNYTFINSLTCWGGAFQDKHCVASKMLAGNNYLVALVGNSVPGRYDPKTTDGASPRHQRLFVNALYNQKFTRIGDTHLHSKLSFTPWVGKPTIQEPEGNRVMFYGCNLLGDPAMTIWISNDQVSSVRPHVNDAYSITDGFRMSCLPRGSTIAVNFTLAKQEHIRLSLLDCAGRKVALISEGTFERGVYSATLQKRNVAAGLYFIELSTEKVQETVTVRLTK